MLAFHRLVDAIEAEGSAALVTLSRVLGSSPRESGARMVVRPSGGFNGTIGGGALEWTALEAARAALREGRGPAARRSLALGPELAQCCGGRVEWRIETFDRRDLAELSAIAAAEARGTAAVAAQVGQDGRVERTLTRGQRGADLTETLPGGGVWTEPVGTTARTVYLFGAGHVGRALALALAPLPFAVRWVDSRREAFPARAPANVALIHAPDPAAELLNAPDGALVVAMTHDHALDQQIVTEALAAGRFGYVGVIGSKTKRARFLSRMRAAGLTEAMLAGLTCPIGVPGIEGKDPAVIAAATAAQLLMADATDSPATRLAEAVATRGRG